MQRQNVQFAVQSALIPSINQQSNLEVPVDFPLFRQKTKSGRGRKVVTVTRIDADGASVSLRHTRGTKYAAESVKITIGQEPIDTGVMAYSLGQGKHASGPEQFAQLLALHARLLARASDAAGPLPEAASDALLESVSQIKKSNGQRIQHENRRGAN
jgi:hypothetical protein